MNDPARVSRTLSETIDRLQGKATALRVAHSSGSWASVRKLAEDIELLAAQATSFAAVLAITPGPPTCPKCGVACKRAHAEVRGELEDVLNCDACGTTFLRTRGRWWKSERKLTPAEMRSVVFDEPAKESTG